MRYLAILSVLLLFSCNDDVGNAPQAEYLYDATEGSLGIIGSQGFIGTSDISVSEFNISTPSPNQKIDENQKIIKTADLKFETENLEETYQKVKAIIAEGNGYIQHDNTTKEYDRLYRYLVIRVPTQNFESAVTRIGEGVSYFDQKTISLKDVTEEFVDLEARLRAKRELENRYLALLVKAENVNEMLDIEKELSTIRQAIEQAEGRLHYLNNKVSFSSINVNFYEVRLDKGTTSSYGNKMGHALGNGWNGISSFFLTLLGSWPFLILVGILSYFIRRWIKRKRKK